MLWSLFAKIREGMLARKAILLLTWMLKLLIKDFKPFLCSMDALIYLDERCTCIGKSPVQSTIFLQMRLCRGISLGKSLHVADNDNSDIWFSMKRIKVTIPDVNARIGSRRICRVWSHIGVEIWKEVQYLHGQLYFIPVAGVKGIGTSPCFHMQQWTMRRLHSRESSLDFLSFIRPIVLDYILNW